ncbi:MAG: TolC family protein [Campylobacterales bacterium]|nr:TolC family protein [Campylobacterales bacterium]
MRRLLFLLAPVLMFGDDLKSLLEFAKKNNDLLVSSKLTQDAKAQDVESKKSAYFPTIDVGVFYKTMDERNLMQAGDVYSGYAKTGLDIYDGGRKSSQLDQAKNEHKASEHDTIEMKKALSLDITKDFYSIKNFEASLVAKQDANKSLQEQLTRIKKYVEAKLATKDDIDRLQAAYDTNMYDIEALRFQILSTHKLLELKVGKSIDSLDASNFNDTLLQNMENSDAIASMMAKESSLINSAESINSAYYPQIRVEESYNIYGYDRADAAHLAGVDKQNIFMVSANMRIFDYGTLNDAKQAVLINSYALKSQVAYKTKEQKMQYDLALFRIETSEIKIKSAKSALVAATSAFTTINEKYNVGIVDYVVYLNALSAKTSAKALYETSLNELEVAYASYYYYSGKNLEEFIK